MSVKIDYTRFDKAHRVFEEYMLKKSGVPFTNFQHPFLIDDEISYKWRVYRNAQDELSLHKWSKWLHTPGQILQAAKNACHSKVSANILEHRYGLKNSSEAALYKVKTPSEVKGLENQLFDFFLGSTDASYEFGVRFDALAQYLRENSLGCNWAFLAYLAFLYRPQSYFPIRPSRFDALLKFYGLEQRIAGFVSWNRYSILLELADSLRSKLSIYGMANAIEIQSYMWVVSYLLHDIDEATMTEPPDFEAELNSRIKQAAERERIGLLGEKYVYDIEIAKLESSGQHHLAEKVQIVSFSDNYTFDLLSFNVGGDEIHIEVKTTMRSPENDGGFWLSENERIQAEYDTQWVIYRVWDIDASPSFENLGNIVLNPREGWNLKASSWYVKHDA